MTAIGVLILTFSHIYELVIDLLIVIKKQCHLKHYGYPALIATKE